MGSASACSVFEKTTTKNEHICELCEFPYLPTDPPKGSLFGVLRLVRPGMPPTQGLGRGDLSSPIAGLVTRAGAPIGQV